MTQTALYRHFDADGVLLYVGVSLSPTYRLSQHVDSDWAKAIRRVDIEKHETREAALDAERRAICAEHPRHNKVRFGGSTMFQSTETVIAYLGPEALKASFGVTQKRIDQCRRDNEFPAAWYDELERLTGRPLPRSLFSFKRRVVGE